MKKYLHHTGAVVCLSVLLLSGSVTSVRAASPPPGAGSDAAYLEDVLLEDADGRERVTLVTSRQAGVTVESPTPKTVMVTLQNLFVPEDLRKSQGEGRLKNIIRAVPSQKSTAVTPVAVVTLDLKQAVPFHVRQEGNNVVIDFDVRQLAGRSSPPATSAGAAAGVSPPATPAPPKAPESAIAKPETTVPPPKVPETAAEKPNGQELMTINLQDSTIKEALELMSTRRPGLSIISTDDVDLKGKLTIHLKAVTWEKAFETILKLKGMDAQRDGKIIIVSTVKKMREDEKDRRDADLEKKKREDEQKAALQKELIERGGLRQISIEAKIIEAEEGFIQDLGVQWGVGNKNSAGDYSYGIVSQATNSTMTTGLRGLAAGTALTAGNLAVNFPLAAASNALGLVISGSQWILDVELMAQEKTNRLRVISSPKVTTMDNVKAIIKQGEEVPFVTPATSTSSATVSFKEAVLKLEVKPKITPEGKISMEIKATNDSPNYARASTLGGNPPINKSEVESTVVINDGDTVIIGGVLKTSDSTTGDAVPWISKIPILGWLFKYENDTRAKRELLIFVTPRIIKDATISQLGGDKKNGMVETGRP